MALLEESGTDRREVRTERGAGRAFVLSPLVYVTVVSGHMEPPVAELLVSYGNERMRRAAGKKLYVFHDWLDMTGYESSCRQRLTTWSGENRAAVAEVHLAQRSKIVAMGVQVANLALGGMIRTHSDRASLEADIRRVLRDTGAAAIR